MMVIRALVSRARKRRRFDTAASLTHRLFNLRDDAIFLHVLSFCWFLDPRRHVASGHPAHQTTQGRKSNEEATEIIRAGYNAAWCNVTGWAQGGDSTPGQSKRRQRHPSPSPTRRGRGQRGQEKAASPSSNSTDHRVDRAEGRRGVVAEIQAPLRAGVVRNCKAPWPAPDKRIATGGSRGRASCPAC